MQKLVFLFIAFFCLSLVEAQDTWTLSRCIEQARTQNIALQRNAIAVENATILDRVNRLQQLPSVNGTMSGGVQFGRTIDPTTDNFGTSSLGYGSLGVNAGIPVYTGGRIKHTIEQGKINVAVTQADLEAAAAEVSLNVALAYLNILLATEETTNAKNRLALSKKQLERTNQLIAAGTLAENNRLDILAQLAQDEQNVILTQNQLTLSYLSLQQLLQLDAQTAFEIVRPEVILPTEDLSQYNVAALYARALETQAQVAASDLRIKSSAYDIEIAQSAKRPSINLFGTLNSNYSTAAKAFEDVQFETVIQETTVLFNGVETTLGLPTTQQVGDIPNKSLTNQLMDNFGQSLGLNISIPIYNQGRNNANIQQAELGVRDAQLQAAQVRQQLYQDVQQSLVNVRAAKLSLQAAQQAKDAAQAAFNNTEKRFEFGAANTFDYNTARNSFDQATINLLRAKYQYIFDTKVLDFYLGKPLSF